MAHNLEVDADGNASFVSNREVPWHRLGTIVDGAMSIDEVLTKARLDWTPELTPVYAVKTGVLGIPTFVQDERHRGVVRTSPITGEYEALGSVGERYEIVSTRDADSFLDYIQDSGEARYETAGALDGGRRVFVSQKLSRNIVLDTAGMADNVDIYLMAYNSFDGTTAFSITATPVRPVCQNTVDFAIDKAVSTWSARHTRNVMTKKAQAREVLGVAYKYVDAFEAEATKMIQTEITKDQFESIIASVWPVSDDASDRVVSRVLDIRDTVRNLYENSDTNANITGTAWGAVNAMTEYVDWYRQINGVDGDLDSTLAYDRRLTDTVKNGPAARLRQKAFSSVQALVGAV